MSFCSSCGHKVNEIDHFCVNCGAKLRSSESEVEVGDVPQTPEPPKPTAQKVEIQPIADAPPRKTSQIGRPAPPTKAQAPRKAASSSEPVKRARGKGGISFFGVLVAFGWLFYSSGLLGVFAGAYRLDVEQLISQADWISFGLMIGLPLGINIFRPVLDIFIIPLQFIKFRIPPRILIGAGLLAPFAVSWLLYSVGGFRNYQFLHYSLVIGTLVTYAILRTPRRYSV